MKASLVLTSLLALLLSACATRSPVAPAADAAAIEQARQQQLQRELALRLHGQWSLAGRVAISNAGKGGSGRIDWQQQGDHYTVSLSAPVTRQSWQLSGDAQGAKLEGIEGGPRSGADPSQLLREATGWEIPVAALASWVRGARAVGLAVEAEQFDAAGHLSRLQQDGWVIDYRWPDTYATPLSLPQRIDAVKGEAKVKLIVDTWALEPIAIHVDDTGDVSPEAALAREAASRDLEQPQADMLKNVAKGDLRPLGVCGYSCQAPGYPQISAAAAKASLNIIDNTGDVVLGEKHLALKQMLARYARGYNLALRDWLQAHPQALQSAASR